MDPSQDRFCCHVRAFSSPTRSASKTIGGSRLRVAGPLSRCRGWAARSFARKPDALRSPAKRDALRFWRWCRPICCAAISRSGPVPHGLVGLRRPSVGLVVGAAVDPAHLRQPPADMDRHGSCRRSRADIGASIIQTDIRALVRLVSQKAFERPSAYKCSTRCLRPHSHAELSLTLPGRRIARVAGEEGSMPT
jgi:hypothetical protein